jgi:hypothetical protein
LGQYLTLPKYLGFSVLGLPLPRPQLEYARVRPRPIPLPRRWPKHIKSGLLHAISLASVAWTASRPSRTCRARLRAQPDHAKSEIALLREELDIKDVRWARSRSRRRPHYTPTQRMCILQLRSARGWTLEKTARVFLADLQTLLHWMRRLCRDSWVQLGIQRGRLGVVRQRTESRPGSGRFVGSAPRTPGVA